MADAARFHPALQAFHRGLAQACGGDDSRLFLLIDAARISGLPAFLVALGEPCRCLYRGELRAELAHVAPYLAEFRLHSDFLPWFFLELDAADASLILVADADLEQLRKHLRRFLVVHDTGGKENFFRFYDPRVLRPFLSACTPEETASFFGPIQSILVCRERPPVREPLFEQWERPCSPPPPHPPDAHAKFQLRPEHEAGFAADAWGRYERSCIAYLRAQHPARLESLDDAEVRKYVRGARKLAGRLEMVPGRIVTLLAESLLLGMSREEADALLRKPVYERPALVDALRDELRKRAANPPEAAHG